MSFHPEQCGAVIFQMPNTYAKLPTLTDFDITNRNGHVTAKALDGTKIAEFGAIIATPPATDPATMPAPAPAIGHTLSFRTSHSNIVGNGGGGTLIVTGNGGRIIDTITVGDTPSIHKYTGANVVGPLEVVFQDEAPGRDGCVDLWIYDDIYDPLITAWLYHNGMKLTVATPGVLSAPPPPGPVTAPTPIPTSRPAEIIITGREPQPLTNIADNMQLCMVTPDGARLQEILNGVDAGKLPVLRMAPGMYVGDELFHDYLYRQAIFESTDPTVMPRLTMGNNAPYNGKSMFDVATGGIAKFLNLEMFHMQNVGLGGRDNICAISVEGGVTDRLDITIAGCVGYDCANFAGRGSMSTYWQILGNIAARNGVGGEGYAHAMYLLGASCILIGNTFMDTQTGHDFKSRCLVNYLERNVFKDGTFGTSSYRVDLPDGGASKLIRNVLESGPNSINGVALHYGGEIPTEFHDNSSLEMHGNRFINYRPGTPIAIRMSRPDKVKPIITGTEAWGGYDLASMYLDDIGGPMPDQGVLFIAGAAPSDALMAPA